MRSPKDMTIIQIDITNACFHHCSNCTRFCGHHRKPFFMDFETFQRAVQSLDGYVGTIGLMGGEPTLHPEFARFAQYLAAHRPPMESHPMIRPQVHFFDSINDLEFDGKRPYPKSCGCGNREAIDGPGLWSAIGEGYKRNYEVIQDTIKRQTLNDHANPMYHQPALITRKELGIPDDEWVKLRDNCWLQNYWSATITPKGAFFCEIAGALDILFDGPGGWPIEPGWWQRTPEQFGDQLHWCELCGFACETFTRDANEEIDDVSPLMYEKLKAVRSPKVAQGRINVVKIHDGVIAEESKASNRKFSGGLHYTDHYGDRFDETTTNMYTKKLVGIVELERAKDMDALLPFCKEWKGVAILADADVLAEVKDLIGLENLAPVLVDRDEHGLGYAMYRMLHDADYETYALVLRGGATPTSTLFERLPKLVLNPGTLLYADEIVFDNAYFEAARRGEAALVNGTAQSIRAVGWDHVLQMTELADLAKAWQPQKIVPLHPSMERVAPTASVFSGKRYVIYGAGQNGPIAVEKIEKGGGIVAGIVDSDSKRQGTSCCGHFIGSPRALPESFDYVMITPALYYHEIKQELLAKGIPETKMAIL